jgi:radical SAM superfamily enzyme YgiQ (UPF0313 family)
MQQKGMTLMNICICTTPIRPVPTTFPPFGSLAIIQSLRKIGEEPRFFNIDVFRPKLPEIEKYFADHQFDVVGISAVVSTAYAYTKFLAGLIRRVSPKSIIVVGGNLAASAEILLRKGAIDYCVVGDGEIVARELIAALRDPSRDRKELKSIKGICYLDRNDNFVFTGYGQRPSAEEVEEPDYSILEADGSLPYFIANTIDDRFVSSAEERSVSGRTATVITSKGCIARCTFCHRWEKGYRALPADRLARHLQFLRDRYQVRFIDVGDENFGSNRSIANEVAATLGSLGMKWRAGGVRTGTIDKEMLDYWKLNGCMTVIYGMESGSQTMLDIMEKKLSVAQNINALKLTYETGLRTVVQLVVAMPGETDRTIRETIEFLKRATHFLYLGNALPSSMISVNYAQSLPGTPLYEYAREHGYIGTGIDEEEQYLLKISDTDAYKEDHFINFTRQPLLKVLMWQQQILAETDAYYLTEKYGTRYSLLRIVKIYLEFIGQRIAKNLPSWMRRLPPSGLDDVARDQSEQASSSGYFNIRGSAKFTPLLLNPITRRLFIPLLALGMAFGKSKNPLKAIGLLVRYVWWHIALPFCPPLAETLPDTSLRKVVRIVSTATDAQQDPMISLRSGR